MTFESGTRFRRSENIVTRDYYGDILLVPIRHDLAELDGLLYHLPNEVAVRVWDLLETDRAVDEIVLAIEAEFDAPAETIRSDVLRFLDQLDSIGGLAPGREAGS